MSFAESVVRDDIDRRIIDLLRSDGRLSWQELGRRTSLSPSAAAERVRRLRERGIITGFRAELSPEALGRTVDAVIGVRAVPGCDRAALEDWLRHQPAIVEAVHLTGPVDYQVRARCRDTAELDALLMAMKSEAGVAETETRVVLRALDCGPPW